MVNLLLYVGTVHSCSSQMCMSNLLPLSLLCGESHKLRAQAEWVPQDP